MRTPTRTVILIVVLLVCVVPAGPARAATRTPTTTTPIKHFIYVMQGDRTFDNYFGTYPGAEGPPANACQPTVPDGPRDRCVKPFALHGRSPQPLPVGRGVVDAQVNGGRMDGFVSAYQRLGRDGTDAMGYYDARDLPFYWNAADRYVLFDRFFANARHGTRLNRSYWIAAGPPPDPADEVPAEGYGDQPTVFDRLREADVSWKFYVQDYNRTETFRAASPTDPAAQTARVPLLNYARFADDPELNRHIVDLDEYYQDLTRGTLPSVAYIASSGASERSARSIAAGQRLVRGLITQLMLSRYWRSAALMWSYDGSGGWYDHVAPPSVGGEELGLRVPALLVSAYARQGHVDHTTLDPTSALHFIEQNWLVLPLTGRELETGSLTGAFDFERGPRAPALIPPTITAAHPPLTHTTLIYWWYGLAGLAAIAFVVAAAAQPALAARLHRQGSPPRRPSPKARKEPAG